jgi:hypothetical protein
MTIPGQTVEPVDEALRHPVGVMRGGTASTSVVSS